MIKKKQFFANNRAIIEDSGRETRYLIDAKEVRHKTFKKFIEGKTLKDGTNRHTLLSQKAQAKMDMAELRYWLADSMGEVDHVDPMTRAMEKVRAEVAQRKLDDKVRAIEQATEYAKLDAKRRLEEDYFDIRLELLEKERRAKTEIEAEKQAIADEEKRRSDYYTYGY